VEGFMAHAQFIHFDSAKMHIIQALHFLQIEKNRCSSINFCTISECLLGFETWKRPTNLLK